MMNRTGKILMAIVTLAAPAYGQHYDGSIPAGGPFSNVAVRNAPFSADAITKVREVLPDGSSKQENVTAHYYRDSDGRVRAELETPWGAYVVVRSFFRDGEPVPGPTERMATWVLDPATRTYRVAASFVGPTLFNGEGRVALPVAKACFQTAPPVVAYSLEAERLRAVGARVASDLGVVIESHRSDSVGSVDYELTNIRREEPPATLFEVPADYTLVAGSSDDPLVSFAPWQAKHSCEPLSR